MPNHRAQNSGQDANKPGGSAGRRVTVPMPEHESERKPVIQLRSQLMAQGKSKPPSGARGAPHRQQAVPFFESGHNAAVEGQMLRDEKKANVVKCEQKEEPKPPMSDLKDMLDNPRKVTRPKTYEITGGVNRQFTSSEGSSDEEEDSKEKPPAGKEQTTPRTDDDDEAAIVGLIIEDEEEEPDQEDDQLEDAREEETVDIEDSPAKDEQLNEELARAEAKIVEEDQHKPSPSMETESQDSVRKPEPASTDDASNGHKHENELIKL